MTQEYEVSSGGVVMPRRTFLVGAVATAGLALTGCQTASVGSPAVQDSKKRAVLMLPNKGNLKAKMVTERDRRDFDYILQDVRELAMVEMDPELQPAFFAVARQVGAVKATIASGYRTWKTNTKVSGAKDSLHPHRKAVDFTLFDKHGKQISVATIYKVALAENFGGVGQYYWSNGAQRFNHIDVGDLFSKKTGNRRGWKDIKQV